MAVGSSPRVRGTPILGAAATSHLRIIPARAGNTNASGGSESDAADHPRACGEHFVAASGGLKGFGSSPRVRGTQRPHKAHLPGNRIIPARAGNTAISYSAAKHSSDHPRACGEHGAASCRPILLFGSSPRVRGTRWAMRLLSVNMRIIPARAGNTAFARKSHHLFSGSSPRVRGTPDGGLGGNQLRRIIPARAGNTLSCGRAACASLDHPRACGEHDCVGARIVVSRGSSPRVRGTPAPAQRAVDGARIIPARAGNTLSG